MPNRIISIEIKVNALSQCLMLQNVEATAKELGVAPNSIHNWFMTKVLPSLPEVLAKEHPGPKPKAASTRPREGKRTTTSTGVEERLEYCPHCQSSRVWKNGRYRVINWLAFLSVRWYAWQFNEFAVELAAVRLTRFNGRAWLKRGDKPGNSSNR